LKDEAVPHHAGALRGEGLIPDMRGHGAASSVLKERAGELDVRSGADLVQLTLQADVGATLDQDHLTQDLLSAEGVEGLGASVLRTIEIYDAPSLAIIHSEVQVGGYDSDDLSAHRRTAVKAPGHDSFTASGRVLSAIVASASKDARGASFDERA